MTMKSANQLRIAAARRQREYRERLKGYKGDLEARAFKADVLVDSIKLAANKGDELAAVIMAAVSEPNVENLTAWFQQRAKAKQPARSTQRNKKKKTQADDGAGVFL
jgi:hypothetical protein